MAESYELRIEARPPHLVPMPEPIPLIAPDALAERLDGGERLQVLDIRAPEKVAQGRLALGPALEFHAMPGSRMYQLSSLEPLGLDARRPVAVICGHGNSSKEATRFLRARGVEAYSVLGGMAAWEAVYVARRLAPTPSLEHIVQLDRVGKGCLSYVVASRGEAVVVDPGRHVASYDALLAQLGARPVAVIDTHAHADHLSGGPRAAEAWRVPYYLHPGDAVSPFDGAAARVSHRPLEDGRRIPVGHAALRVVHNPGHTLGSVALMTDDGVALTGDFVFIKSLGRPDLGGQAEAWGRLLWQSLENARREWPGDILVLPAHYASETERRADRAVAARFDVIRATNDALGIADAAAFARWLSQNPSPPPIYRTIKVANLGLAELSEADAETLESGPNQCAVK